MVLDQFIVQPQVSFGSSIIIVGVCLIAVGVALVLLAVSSKLIQLAHIADRINSFFSVSKDTGNKYAWIILGIILIIGGGIMVSAITSAISPSVVTVSNGYINVESNAFTSVGAIFCISSSKNVTSEEITAAFVGQIGSGDFKLHKQYGLNSGDTNIGLYTLGNGAKAYVATTNSTSLIIELKNGEYLIVGSSDTYALANSFAQNVHPLNLLQNLWL
jgi:hypothetical protein